MTDRPRRCAIYTRKSSEEGLDQAFNSLDAQREACEAYIKSQAHEGWRLIPTAYDDGGYSGGSLERPAVARLMADVGAGLIDIVVVYKVDRLTRSLADFAKIVEALDARGASFVSVTQQFNTTSSMGRLTLNVLLSFAQFEREVTGERIRDKIAASRRKGMWMGGTPALGYDVRERKLIVNQHEAEQVRSIYAQYLELGCVSKLAAALKRRGIGSKVWKTQKGMRRGGGYLGRGALYDLLQNQVYRGMAVHKGTAYPGEHQPIVPQDLWDRVQSLLEENRTRHGHVVAAGSALPLTGLLFDDRGNRMSPSHVRNRHGRRYAYYVSQASIQGQPDAIGSIARVPALAIEAIVEARVKGTIPDSERRTWGQLQPAERAARLRSVVRRVVVKAEEIEITLARGTSASPTSTKRTSSSIETASDQVLRIPIRLKTSGGERTILTMDGAPVETSRPDKALIRALARAHHWREMLESGSVRSTADLAVTVGCHVRYIRNILKLAFLAPDVADTILSGRQPVGLTLTGLMAQQVPLSWVEQRRILGFRAIKP